MNISSVENDGINEIRVKSRPGTFKSVKHPLKFLLEVKQNSQGNNTILLKQPKLIDRIIDFIKRIFLIKPNIDVLNEKINTTTLSKRLSEVCTKLKSTEQQIILDISDNHLKRLSGVKISDCFVEVNKNIYLFNPETQTQPDSIADETSIIDRNSAQKVESAICTLDAKNWIHTNKYWDIDSEQMKVPDQYDDEPPVQPTHLPLLPKKDQGVLLFSNKNPVNAIKDWLDSEENHSLATDYCKRCPPAIEAINNLANKQFTGLESDEVLAIKMDNPDSKGALYFLPLKTKQELGITTFTQEEIKDIFTGMIATCLSAKSMSLKKIHVGFLEDAAQGRNPDTLYKLLMLATNLCDIELMVYDDIYYSYKNGGLYDHLSKGKNLTLENILKIIYKTQ